MRIYNFQFMSYNKAQTNELICTKTLCKIHSALGGLGRKALE